MSRRGQISAVEGRAAEEFSAKDKDQEKGWVAGDDIEEKGELGMRPRSELCTRVRKGTPFLSL